MRKCGCFNYFLTLMEVLNPFLTRLNTLMEYYRLNKNSFCKRTNVSPTTLSSMFIRNAEPTFKICVSILESFEDVSTDWLMLGKGEMLKSKSVSVEQSNINNGSVSGDLNQSISNMNTDELAKIKLMLKGCSTIEEFQFVADIINKATNQ